MMYIVEPVLGLEAEEGRWLVRVRNQVIATFRTKEAACRSARTLARLDLLAAREAEAWLFGCEPGPQMLSLEGERVEPETPTRPPTDR